MKEELVALIVDVASDVREQEGIDSDESITAETRLFGDGGLFDSMGLVSLIVAVEQTIDERLSRRVSLADEKALSQKVSPYRTVASLADYADQQMQE